MKLWLDDVRLAPPGYEWARSVREAKFMIVTAELKGEKIEIIDVDHDLGDGVDGIKLLDWLVERGSLYEIKIHSANPVGRANMERMIKRYWGK